MATPDRQIGRALRRFEDARFLQGRGRFVEDIDLPGQLHGIVLRSPHGHAEIATIDTSAARALPGVHGVFTAADLSADNIGPLPCIAQVATVGIEVLVLQRDQIIVVVEFLSGDEVC